MAIPQRTNSTNPRPGNSAFSRGPGGTNSRNSRTRTGSRKQSCGGATQPAAAPASAAGTPAAGDSGKQIKQTLAVTMTASPITLVPFPLNIPLGITTLIMPTGGQKK